MEVEFIGLSALLDAHGRQVQDFERWATQGEWRQFHTRHYDWWAFPIGQPSRSHGHRYAVPWEEVQQLRDDQAFWPPSPEPSSCSPRPGAGISPASNPSQRRARTRPGPTGPSA